MNNAPRYSTIWRFALVTLLLLVGCNGCTPARPTIPARIGAPMPVRLHWARVAEEPRRELADRYRALFRAPTAHEYGFCAIALRSRDDGTPVVVAVVVPDSQRTGPHFASFRCPAGTIRGHAHPPAACDPDPNKPGDVALHTCTFQTQWGHQCMPSAKDVDVARRLGMGIIQCDVNAFVFYSAGDST